MTFDVSNGRMLIDKGGVTRLNTDDALLHGTTQGLPINGTVAIPSVTGGNSGSPGTVNRTDVYDLGAATSGHTQLIGVCKFTLNNYAAGLAFDRWHLVMGGNILWVMDGESGFGDVLGDNSSLQQWVDYHFRIAAGRVEMVRRLYIDNSPFSYTVLSHSIQYRLRSGNWT